MGKVREKNKYRRKQYIFCNFLKNFNFCCTNCFQVIDTIFFFSNFLFIHLFILIFFSVCRA